jgi:hypothetical protein
LAIGPLAEYTAARRRRRLVRAPRAGRFVSREILFPYRVRPKVRVDRLSHKSGPEMPGFRLAGIGRMN